MFRKTNLRIFVASLLAAACLCLTACSTGGSGDAKPKPIPQKYYAE